MENADIQFFTPHSPFLIFNFPFSILNSLFPSRQRFVPIPFTAIVYLYDHFILSVDK